MQQHKAYGSIDLHARTMDIGIWHQDGEGLVPHTCTASPETFLKVIAPSREDLGGAVECQFT